MRAPPDVLEIFLQPGDFYFGEGRTRIRTLLGSCIAITLWHPHLRVGGMCHYMLPTRTRRARARLDGRYADDAMQLFLQEMRRYRTVASEYEVKMFGGGDMFPAIDPGAARASVSERNVEAGRQLLETHGFALGRESLGGTAHRNVLLDLWSGETWLRAPQC